MTTVTSSLLDGWSFHGAPSRARSPLISAVRIAKEPTLIRRRNSANDSVALDGIPKYGSPGLGRSRRARLAADAIWRRIRSSRQGRRNRPEGLAPALPKSSRRPGAASSLLESDPSLRPDTHQSEPPRSADPLVPPKRPGTHLGFLVRVGPPAFRLAKPGGGAITQGAGHDGRQPRQDTAGFLHCFRPDDRIAGDHRSATSSW
jgi:hypothetical protein